MVQVDGLLGSFLPILTAENYRSLVSLLVAEVAAQLEKAVLQSSFNRVIFSKFSRIKVNLFRFSRRGPGYGVQSTFHCLFKRPT